MSIGEIKTKLSLKKLKKGNRFMKSQIERLSKPELDFLIDNCNFLDDEVMMLKMVAKGYSELEIASAFSLSVSSITKRKRKILRKIIDFVERVEDMTTIYVNGKRVTKDELKNYEIKIENVKKILSDKLTKKK